MTRHTKVPLTFAIYVLVAVCLANGWLFARPVHAEAVVSVRLHVAPPRHHARGCPRNARNVSLLPAPRVTFEAPYVPRTCDPMHLLPKQAWRLFACVRWREGGDMANQPNGAGMYQFTNRATWDEFRGAFPEVPSEATALEQDIVAYRVWRTEQFLPWNGDPCLGSVHQLGKWGWY